MIGQGADEHNFTRRMTWQGGFQEFEQPRPRLLLLRMNIDADTAETFHEVHLRGCCDCTSGSDPI